MIRRIISWKVVLIVAVFAASGLSAAAYLASRANANISISTVAATRGDVIESISASGTLEPVTTVQVGAQVSGNIQALYADFNAIVRRGQLLARLDPTLLQSQTEQARANVIRAEAEVERLKAALASSEATLRRTQALADRRIAAAADLEAAVVTRRMAESDVKSAEAQLLQARASLSQTEVNLEKTAITSPIDGIVVSRNVDVGQTVAASMQAPTIFLIAADLAKMRVNASVDESDVGRVKAGQTVRFRVDAFPAEEFVGTVSQVRLSPTVEQNVVTYQTVIDVPNLELKLRPGMTANVTIETLRRENVLRAPNAALRFKPTSETYALLGQPAPADNGTGPKSRTSGAGSGADPVLVSVRMVRAAGTAGRVWVMRDETLTPVDVRLGASDGAYTELLEPAITDGTELIWSVASARQQTTQSTTPTGNPFLGTQPRPPMGPPPAGTRPG